MLSKFFLILSLTAFVSQGSVAREYSQTRKPKISLFEWSQKTKSDVTQAENFFQLLEAGNASASGFVSGELSDPAQAQMITDFFKQLISRAQKSQSSGKTYQRFELLSAMIAVFIFEESSRSGLDWCQKAQESILQAIDLDLQKRDQKSPWNRTELNSLLRFKSLWPVDRVVLFELRKFLPQADERRVSWLVSQLQKNIYQSVESLLKKQPLSQPKDQERASALWTQNDIRFMRSQVSHLGRLQIQVAGQVFSAEWHKKPVSLQQLIDAKLLSKVPLNYESGKAFALKDPQHCLSADTLCIE